MALCSNKLRLVVMIRETPLCSMLCLNPCLLVLHTKMYRQCERFCPSEQHMTPAFPALMNQRPMYICSQIKSKSCQCTHAHLYLSPFCLSKDENSGLDMSHNM